MSGQRNKHGRREEENEGDSPTERSVTPGSEVVYSDSKSGMEESDSAEAEAAVISQ